MAITWQTVRGGDSSGAVSLTSSGSRLMMESLGALQRAAAEQQQLNIANNKLQTERNTNDYLDRVAQYTSSADLSDPTVQQDLLQMRAGYGEMINRAATRTAIDERNLALQKMELAGNQYQDAVQEREQRPLVEQITALSRSGDRAGVDKLLADVSFLNEDQIARAADQNLDAVTNRGYQAENQARAGRAEDRAIRGEARANEQFNLSKQMQQLNMADRLEARQEKRSGNLLKAAELELQSEEAFLRAKNPLANTSTDPIKDANDSVNKIADEIQPWLTRNAPARDKLTNAIAGLMADGLDVGGDIGKVKIPKALVDQYLSQARDKSFLTTAGFGSGENGGLLGDLKDWMKTYAISNPGAFRQASEVGDQIKQLRASQRSINEQRINMLKGNSLDSDKVSGMLSKLRGTTTAASILPSAPTGSGLASKPTLNLMPERDEDTR